MPQALDRLARQVAGAVEALRGLNLYKPPGVAETIDWAQALTVLGTDQLDAASLVDSLGAVVKERDDLEVVDGHLDELAIDG